MSFVVMWDDKGYYLPSGRRGNIALEPHPFATTANGFVQETSGR
jgi:hypothetical protein